MEVASGNKTLSSHCILFSFHLASISCSLAETFVLLETRLSRFGKKNGKLFKRRVFHTFYSRLASFNMLPVCLKALHGRPLSNGTNWGCQVSHKCSLV